MKPRHVTDLVFAEPFRPLRIHVADDRVFDVRHAEDVGIGRSKLAIYTPPDNDPDGPERWVDITLDLIESIEPLDLSGKDG